VSEGVVDLGVDSLAGQMDFEGGKPWTWGEESEINPT
jgi:hypothetical protein